MAKFQKHFLFAFLLFFSIFVANDFCAAKELEVLLPGGPTTTATPLAEYVKYIFEFSIGIAGLIAFISLVWGGFIYFISQGEASKISEAKERMLAGIIGLIILLSSYLILNTINPQLVTMELDPIQGVCICDGSEPPECKAFCDKITSLKKEAKEREEMVEKISLWKVYRWYSTLKTKEKKEPPYHLFKIGDTYAFNDIHTIQKSAANPESLNVGIILYEDTDCSGRKICFQEQATIRMLDQSATSYWNPFSKEYEGMFEDFDGCVEVIPKQECKMPKKIFEQDADPTDTIFLFSQKEQEGTVGLSFSLKPGHRVRASKPPFNILSLKIEGDTAIKFFGEQNFKGKSICFQSEHQDLERCIYDNNWLPGYKNWATNIGSIQAIPKDQCKNPGWTVDETGVTYWKCTPPGGTEPETGPGVMDTWTKIGDTENKIWEGMKKIWPPNWFGTD